MSRKRDGLVLGTDPSVKGSPQKHAKGSEQQENPFHLLADDATMFLIFEFIGLHHFRFVAGVSRRWRSLFTQFQREEYRKMVPNEEAFNGLISTSTTSTVSIAESVSRANVFVDDAKKRRGRGFRTICVRRNDGSQYWRSYGEQWPDPLKFLAESVGIQHCLKVLQVAISNGYICDERTLAYAAGNGQLETVEWLREIGCPWDDEVFQAAVNGGHVDVIEWLELHDCPLPEHGQCSVCGDTGPITRACGQCGEDGECYYL